MNLLVSRICLRQNFRSIRHTITCLVSNNYLVSILVLNFVGGVRIQLTSAEFSDHLMFSLWGYYCNLIKLITQWHYIKPPIQNRLPNVAQKRKFYRNGSTVLGILTWPTSRFTPMTYWSFSVGFSNAQFTWTLKLVIRHYKFSGLSSRVLKTSLEHIYIFMIWILYSYCDRGVIVMGAAIIYTYNIWVMFPSSVGKPEKLRLYKHMSIINIYHSYNNPLTIDTNSEVCENKIKTFSKTH